MNVSEDEVLDQKKFFESGAGAIEQIVRDKTVISHGIMQHIIGSYFRTRTFNFLYAFSRNEFKLGKQFKRFFVQPLNISCFLTLPWLVINFFDSLIIRLFYTQYCVECNWKYVEVFGGQKGHDSDECSYNKEYTAVIEEILNGHIINTEEKFRRAAEEKRKNNKKSAYYDLCSYKSEYQAAVDVACIWFSSGIIVYLIVWLALPLTVSLVNSIIVD